MGFLGSLFHSKKKANNKNKHSKNVNIEDILDASEEITFEDLFNIENDKYNFNFDIDLEKGLYVGAGVKLVGKTEERFVVRPIYIKWGDLSGHLAVYGTTRVGKTRLMVSMIRQCILRGMDIIVIEPKGAVGNKKNEKGEDLGIGQETIAWILEFAEEANRLRDIVYISPKFSLFSKKFNAIFGMGNEEIASLVASMIPSDEQFYPDMGYQIVMAVLLGLDILERIEGKETIKERIEEEYKKINSYTNIINEVLKISKPDLVEKLVDPTLEKENLFDEKEQHNLPYRSLVTFADIVKYSTIEGIQSILSQVQAIPNNVFDNFSSTEKIELLNLRDQAIKALKEMAEKDKTYYSKVSSSFNVIMSQLSTGELGEILTSVKINPIIDRFNNKDRGQIIIIQPFPLVYKKASDNFVRIIFNMLTSFFGNIGASGRSTPREICLFVDEGGAVLYKGVQDLFNKAGGLGLRIFIFTQSFADYDAELGPEIAKIVNDNTNIKIFMRMNDNESRTMVAEAFGKIREGEAMYMGSKLDMRINTRQTEKDLLLPAHMGDMQKQEFLLQYGEGRFYCVAPFQPDPKFLIKMPTVKMEELFKNIGGKYQTKITEKKDIKEKIII